MKKSFALLSTLLILVGIKTKAQGPTQVPVKKETTKPSNGNAPKTQSVDTYLKINGVKGESDQSKQGTISPNFTKGSKTINTNGASSNSQSVAPRHTPPPPNQSVAPRHKG